MRQILLGCPVDILTMRETVDQVRDAIRSRRRLQHVALNVAKLVNMRQDPALATDVVSSDIVGVDGMGIVFAAKCLGIPVMERVAGIDLFFETLSLCANEGFKPFFLGATEDILRRAVQRVSETFPAITIAGARNGYFPKDEEAGVVTQIRQSGADCLFIGISSPRKERLLARYRDEFNVPFIMGVGGSFDILAGQIQRAPMTVQRLGCEWLYRVYQEPRRMWWRYTRTNTLFLYMLIRAMIARGFSDGFGRRRPVDATQAD